MEFNIADLLESMADVAGDETAVVCGTRRLTYAELDARANRLANFLKSRGLGKGSHLGLHLFNCVEYIEGMLAAFKLRAVPINVNYRYVEGELRYVCDNADLAAILTQGEFAPMIGRIAREAARLETVILVGDIAAGDRPDEKIFDYERAVAGASPARDFEPRSADDLFIVYTGGTTGMPKGVMWRHEDVFFAGLQGGNPGGTPISRPEELAENYRSGNAMSVTMLPTAPLIHGSAQWTALICLFTGAKVVLQPGKSFDPKRVLELIGEEQVGTLTLVGDAMARPLMDLLTAPGASYDVSSLIVVASAGAVLSPVVREQMKAALPDVMIINSFGSTESGHFGSALPGAETGIDGRPSFFMDAATSVVFDDDYRPIEPGSKKQGFLARGGRITLGYYKDEEKTKARFVTIAGKRWVIPGDLATVEADGRITVFGRGSECINSGGEKVFPEEVEEALKSHPDVFDALVVGIEDERWMQRVAALVEPRPGKRPTLEELQQHCRKHIAGYKIPRQSTLVDKVARFQTGKPDYAWAKKIAAEAKG
jgi:acyl-CoA synthetase (AMP-forming)/AMP-acid ligase II